MFTDTTFRVFPVGMTPANAHPLIDRTLPLAAGNDSTTATAATNATAAP